MCDCADGTFWEVIKLVMTLLDTGESLYEDHAGLPSKFLLFVSKTMDSQAFGLTTHYSSAAFGELEDDGKLLFEFMEFYGTDDHAWPKWAFDEE